MSGNGADLERSLAAFRTDALDLPPSVWNMARIERIIHLQAHWNPLIH